MKPYNFDGGQHNNMAEICKWGESSRYGVRRRFTRVQDRTFRKLTNARGRRASKAAIAEQV
jgi:hypothetical protein